MKALGRTEKREKTHIIPQCYKRTDGIVYQKDKGASRSFIHGTQDRPGACDVDSALLQQVPWHKGAGHSREPYDSTGSGGNKWSKHHKPLQTPARRKHFI